MCNGVLFFDEIAAQFQLTVDDIKEIVNYDAHKLVDFEKDGIISISDKGIVLSELGHKIARNIAMAFDPDLKQGESIYSKTV
jgi:oxygen-independent coproporphyrinogen-3 oxidase